MTATEKFKIRMQHEDWLDTAIPSIIQQLELIRDGRWPRVLKGWCVITIALRLLRCVWGDDASTLHGLQHYVIGNLEFSKECHDHWNVFPRGCPDADCQLCVDVREDRGVA